MYAPNMWERFRGAPVVVMAAWSLASCDTPARSAAVPAPEAEQVVSAALKKLYMTASAAPPQSDRKSTRLNSSHLGISYAVFCLKKTFIQSASPQPPFLAGDDRLPFPAPTHH